MPPQPRYEDAEHSLRGVAKGARKAEEQTPRPQVQPRRVPADRRPADVSDEVVKGSVAESREGALEHSGQEESGEGECEPGRQM